MKKKSTRIFFKFKEKLYKFMSFFIDQKDNSFYFHLYEERGKNYKSFNLTQMENGATKIDLNDYSEHDFKRQKFSIHQSGYIHSTDKYGKRLKDGTVGIRFDKIESSSLVLILGPKKVDTLPELEQIDDTRDIGIHLSDHIEPFTINFEVFRKDQIETLAINHENNLLNGYIEVTHDSKDYGLRFYLQTITGKGIWPEFTFNLFRTG